MTSIRAVPKTYGMSPAEAAAIWVVRLDRGTLTSSEEAEFAEWLATPQNDEAFSKADGALHVFDADRDSDPHLLALRQAALEAAAPARRRYPLLIAASVAAIGVATVLLMGRAGQFGPAQAPSATVASVGAPAVASASVARPLEYTSDIGKRRTIPLPDGSTITLNTNSQVMVTFTEGRRLIRLVRGEALFDVAHNPQRPFIVLAGERRVTALGTFFEVRVDADRTRVVLVNGHVVVDRGSEQGQSSSSKAGEPVLLEPGQGFIAQSGRAQRVFKVDLKRELLWRSGFVQFDDESLGRAIAEINRYTSLPIELSPDGVANLRVSGVFRTDDARHFADSVSELLSLDVKPTPQGGIRLSRAKKDSPPTE